MNTAHYIFVVCTCTHQITAAIQLHQLHLSQRLRVKKTESEKNGIWNHREEVDDVRKGSTHLIVATLTGISVAHVNVIQ